MLNKTVIAIKKGHFVLVDQQEKSTSDIIKRQVLTLNTEMVALGYIMSQSLFQALEYCSTESLAALSHDLLSALKRIRGADVKYQPMYPNFPQQVIEADEVELYLNAIFHYWTAGYWKPEYPAKKRAPAHEEVKLVELTLGSEDEFQAIFPQLLASNDSLSAEDQDIVTWFIQQYPVNELTFPEEISFNEIKCVVAGELIKKGDTIKPLVKTSTDILRIATHLSGGDVSLASNTKFNSFNRAQRKLLVKALDEVINEEDIGRHAGKWVRLFHGLHVGDYSEKVYSIAKKVRNNEAIRSFYGRLELLLENADILKACDLLKQRPGEFGRKLDHLLRLAEQTKQQVPVCNAFLSVVDDIPTRNLLQLLGHLLTRHQDKSQAIVFPKGNVQNSVIIDRPLKALESNILSYLVQGIRHCLYKRFAEFEPLGKVWIDPELMDCPLPTQQRSAASGLKNVARGTHLPIGDKDTLRFFIYWVGQDIDLSATFHDESFNMIAHVSYTQLKSAQFQAYHSGDITRAPKGASEFIDISVSQAQEAGARYVAMNVLVYSGPTFAEHKKCYAGWMMRSKPNSNEIYDPKTVEQRIDVRTPCRSVMPVIFDLVERKAIWVDLKITNNGLYGGNNIESNRASIQDKLKAIVRSDNKMTLYELFELHAIARGQLAADKEDADTVFSIDEGIGPYDINKINAEFIR